jgi:hypothetical protein
VTVSRCNHFKAEFVIVAANFAYGHAVKTPASAGA